MPAIIDVNRKTGASGSILSQPITAENTRAHAADVHSEDDLVFPVQKPASGDPDSYSYWVTTRLNVTTTPAGVIDNLRWYTDGSNGLGTGITCYVAKASLAPDAGYRQATGTEGKTGNELTLAIHTGLDEAPSDAFAFTFASPKALVGSLSNPDTGEFGDHVVYQIIVSDSAALGVSNQETFAWGFDET